MRAKALPITANCTRFSVSHSTLAPRSSITLSPRRVGNSAAIAGRSIPGSVFNTIFAIAISAPVLPAETTQSALSVRDRIDRQPHAGSASGPQRNRRLGVGEHDIGRVVHGCGVREPRQLCQQRRDAGFVAEQQKAHGRVALEGDIGPLQHHCRSPIAAHRVDGDRDSAVHRVTVRALPEPRR